MEGGEERAKKERGRLMYMLILKVHATLRSHRAVESVAVN